MREHLLKLHVKEQVIERAPLVILDEKYLILKTLGDGRYAR